ncbi:thermonuclease family protein [Arthrobacter sp. ISL-69]|uniref:thermonuclease family protein n=1 Tax=Arthrobacter sp. ISL-69 TaxID=2819113 RepID=UPI00288B250F|nr:thermonuclease family protein [Arthrobacter sp. ISL-69]
MVVRVIDGDTFTARTNGEEKTIRLLNVDTPETKDPNAPVECMGPEATKALEELLPAGAVVRLELDIEPLDKYGRTLAGVFNSAGLLVNAEVARLGFGIPVLFEPNKKFHPDVVKAYEEAMTRGVGLGSADIPCLPAQQVEQAADAVESLAALPLAGTDVELDRSHAGLVTALAAIAALKTAASAKKQVHWRAYEPGQVASMITRLDAAAAAGASREAAIGAKKTEIANAAAAEAARAEAAAAEAARAEAAAVEAARAEAAAAEAARAAQEAAAAAAEAERIRNLPPAPAPYVPPVYVPPVYVPPAAPAPVQNPYPGYTGPRCYAPGGKSWTPCK